MDAQKILIADGNDEFRLALTEALALLRSFCPDILVLDLLLPGLDGISLLHSAVNANICPMVLATAKFLSQYMTDVFDCLQVDYFMMKPCDIQATVDRIHDLSQRIRRPLISQPDPRNYITGLLVNLGVPPKAGWLQLSPGSHFADRETTGTVHYQGTVSRCRRGIRKQHQR